MSLSENVSTFRPWHNMRRVDVMIMMMMMIIIIYYYYYLFFTWEPVGKMVEASRHFFFRCFFPSKGL